MIYTLTLNPSIDYFMKVEGTSLMESEVNRSSEELYKAGGKGINVSLILDKLKIPSTAMLLLAGFTGDFIKTSLLEKDYVNLKAIEAQGNNRINVKIHNGSSHYSVNGNGPIADDNIKRNILNVLSEIGSDDWVLICGSMAKNMDTVFLIEMANVVHEKGAKLIIDMESMDMELLKLTKPYLIKPNLYEFKLLLEDSSITLDNLDVQLKKAIQEGPENILLSLGASGAMLATQEAIYHLTQPKINAVNDVGPGDAMLATFIGKISEGAKAEEALAWGGAAGCAVVSTFEDVNATMIEKFVCNMKVEKI